MTNSHSGLKKPLPINNLLRHFGAEIGLLALCLFLFFWRLGSIPLIDYDEALYVTCAQQMVTRGDWVTPRLNTRQPERPGVTAIAFFEKPVLVYWAAAGAMRLFGFVMWAARLPVALASLLTTGLVYAAGKRWFTRRAGLLAALVYATAPMTLLDARQMTTDALLVLWITGALLCFQSLHTRGEEDAAGEEKKLADKAQAAKDIPFVSPSPPLPLFFWLFCALAVLTKGVVGLLLPFLVIGVSSLSGKVVFSGRPRLRVGLRPGAGRVLWATIRENIACLHPLSGLLLFALIAVPWHVLIAGRADLDAQGRTWVQEYILRQHIGRFRGLDAVHNQPIFMFALYFLVGFFPWACFAPAAFRGERQKEKRERDEPLSQSAQSSTESHQAADVPGRSAGMNTDPFLLSPSSFLRAWFWTIFVFFSLGAAKLPTYITPAYPAAALLVGQWLDRALSLRRNAKSSQADLQNPYLEEQADDRMARSMERGALGASGVGVLLLIAAFILPSHVPASAPLPDALFRFAQHVALLFTLGSVAAWLCFWQAGRDSRLRVGDNHLRMSDSRLRMAGVAVLAAMMTLLIGIAATEGYAMAGDYVMGPYQALARAARADAQAGIPVVFYSISPRRPSMLFYAGYSPLEHKEPGLLPFLAPTLSRTQRSADVIAPLKAYTKLLLPEIQAVPGATMQMLQQQERGNGWVLARIYVPPSYVPPPVQSLKSTP